MIDIKLLRSQMELVYQKLKKRGFNLDIKKFYFLDNKKKTIQNEVENLRYQCNNLSKLIGKYKSNIEYIQKYKIKVLDIKKKITDQSEKLKKITEEINYFMSQIPNMIDDTVPIGMNFDNNVEIYSWGDKKKFNFIIQNHIDLGNNINGFDWFSAAKISGSRFFVLKGKMALLYRALGQFMLDIHTQEHGYLETYVPYLVNYNSMYGTGQLPKFKNELFYVSDYNTTNKKYILIPTAEVPLTNLFQNKILHEKEFPIMLTAYTPCFRAESLSYGKDTKGLIRTHQFDKVEIFQINTPENSMYILEELTLHAEKILKLLNLPYRKMLLCTGDTGFSSSKTYDLEVWFPYQNCYKEISSCSNMIDFQSRRIHLKYYQNNTKKKFFPHTINGSGLSIGRTLAAILENYQNDDGTIQVPNVLIKKYMHGIEIIN